jgi:hypothetical protein
MSGQAAHGAITARHLMSLLLGNGGKGGHTDPADPHEMDTDGTLHDAIQLLTKHCSQLLFLSYYGRVIQKMERPFPVLAKNSKIF